MKKTIPIIICVLILGACGLFFEGSHRNTSVQFTFVDARGKDIFLDSLQTSDFSITALEGSTTLSKVDTAYGKTYFVVFFGDKDGVKFRTLFHFRDDTDTLVVRLNKKGNDMKYLYYNGEKIHFESDLSSYCTIVK